MHYHMTICFFVCLLAPPPILKGKPGGKHVCDFKLSSLRTALSRFLGLQECEGRFLSRKREAYDCGMLLCKRYTDLAWHAIRQVGVV